MSRVTAIAAGFARLVQAINTLSVRVTTVQNARTVPVYLADGSASSIALNASGELPCYLADGTATGIQVQA